MSDIITPEKPAYVPKPQPRLSRLIQNRQITFQEHGRSPIPAPELAVSRWLLTNEPPYSYDLDLTGDWKPLKLGWFGETQDENAGAPAPVGLLLIRNEVRVSLPGLPDSQYMVAFYSRAIHVAIIPEDPTPVGTNRTMFSPDRPAPVPQPFALVLPGEELPITPTDIRRLRLRVPGGSGKARITLYTA